MPESQNILREPGGDKWGGPWTERKLDAFERYVKAYLTIMSKFPYWKTIYFDGFAGSGNRENNNAELMHQLSISWDEQQVYKGAAERVVQIDDPISFDWYYFVEKNEQSVNELKRKLLKVSSEKESKLVFRTTDCNAQLVQLAKALRVKKNKLASLIFIDPFGMHITWESIAKLKDTRSDVWVLIPTGVIVNRLLDKKGKLKSIKLLKDFFGMNENDIRKEFYSSQSTTDLFGNELEEVRKVLDPINHIARIYKNNLKKVWKHVTEVPLRLNNRNGTPIFHFVFASNNKNAVKIAQQIIEKL